MTRYINIIKHNNDLSFTNVTAVTIGRRLNKFRGLMRLPAKVQVAIRSILTMQVTRLGPTNVLISLVYSDCLILGGHDVIFFKSGRNKVDSTYKVMR